MPFYEYECQKCGHQLEAMQKISDAPLRKCPVCGKQALRKLMSSPVFRLKGSGWYETDFKSDKEGKRNLADQPEKEDKKDDKKDEKKETTDKKEESKAEPTETAVKVEAKPEAKSESVAKPAVSTAAAGKSTPAAPRTRRRIARRHK